MLKQWSNPGKGVTPLDIGVEAIEKEAFWSPSTKVTNFILLFIYNAKT